MVRRRAVGATMVAAVVFSALLACDLAVYIASQDRGILYSEAYASEAMSQSFLVLEAAEGVDILYGAGLLLASSAFQCSTAAPEIAQGVGGLSDSQTSGGLTVSVRASVGGTGDQGDNLSALSPLDGWVPGELDIVLHYDASGSDGPGVTFAKGESHYVHIGVRVHEAVSRCEAAASAFAQALSRPADNCTVAPLGAEADKAIRTLVRSASEEGFALSISYSVTATPTCSVSYDVRITQSNVRGVSSTFGVTFYQEGFVTVPSPAQPAQG